MVYVGQTIRPIKDRFASHLSNAMNENSGSYNTHLSRAIRKYGKDCFVVEQIDTAETKEDLCKKEAYWINHYDSCRSGYNMNPGGFSCGGNTYANVQNLDEIRHKISLTKLGGKNPNSRSVIMTDLQTNTSTVFHSMKEAADYLGLSSHMQVSRMCRGVKMSPVNGRFVFEYYDKKQCND